MDFNNLKYEQEKILDKIFDFIYGCALHDARQYLTCSHS